MQKRRFVELLLESGVLNFGSFLTKSGRRSPYFFNTGKFDSGERLGKVADLYAEALLEHFGSRIDNLFGPAYKGIPLAVLTSDRLAKLYRKDVSFTFNRKETKDHGEGGLLVGHEYKGNEKVVIVEDVLTGGTSLRETESLLRRLDIQVLGIFVGIDRQEKGSGESSARTEIEQLYQAPVFSLVNMDDIVTTLFQQTILGHVWIDDALKVSIDQYREEYCR
jgi:orotate phosphoribosyltransferase